MIAIGFLLGALLPTVRTTQAVAAAIYFPAIFVSGALFPREVLPDVRPANRRLPADDVRGALDPRGLDRWAPSTGIGPRPSWPCTTVVVLAVAVRMFRWEAR